MSLTLMQSVDTLFVFNIIFLRQRPVVERRSLRVVRNRLRINDFEHVLSLSVNLMNLAYKEKITCFDPLTGSRKYRWELNGIRNILRNDTFHDLSTRSISLFRIGPTKHIHRNLCYKSRLFLSVIVDVQNRILGVVRYFYLCSPPVSA